MRTQLRFVNEAAPTITGNKIGGMAAVFNRVSEDLGGFREIIRPGAFDRSLREIAAGTRHVDARIQHEGGLQVCGSTANGTLKLEVNKEGLWYELTPPDTQAGRDLVTMVRDGYLRHSSFAFDCEEEALRWSWNEKPPLVEVLDLDLIDVAPCSRPAYEEATVALRSLMARKSSTPGPAARSGGPEAPVPEYSRIEIKNESGGKVVEFHLFDEVLPGWLGRYYPDLVTASSITKTLAEHEDAERIDLYVNSPGGDVFEGVTIFNTLKAHPAPVHVYVQGMAASIAAVIAMAGDHIRMGQGSMLMIHRAWGVTGGTASEMRDMARLLDKIDLSLAGVLATRSGNDLKRVEKWMQDETWFTADEAVASGFADRILSGEYAQATAAHAARCRALGYTRIPATLGGPDPGIRLRRTSENGAMLAELRVQNERTRMRRVDNARIIA